MNLVITGSRGSGKTTAVHRMLKYVTQPPYGFWTQKLPAPPECDAPVYLHSFREPVVFTPENQIGCCRNRSATSNPAVFDKLGVRILREIPRESFVVFDEIGIMEENAAQFRAELLRILDGDYMTLITVRDLNTSLLDAIRSHSKSVCISVQEANDELVARDLSRLFHR